MNGEIILTQPSVFAALCVLGGIAVAALLYWREDKFGAAQRLGLAALRAIAVALIAFLLLGPLLRSVDTQTQRPVFVIAEDRSASAKTEVEALTPAIDELTEGLTATYDVRRLIIGERVRAAGDTLSDETTDLAQLFEYAADNYPAELLGGVLLATDGIYNRGSDPAYAAARLTAPVYAIPVGDTTPTRDVAVRDVLYNQIAYLGDKIEVIVDVDATNASGASSNVVLSQVSPDGRSRRIDAENVAFPSAKAFNSVRFELTPEREGVARYRVSASTLENERNRVNNSRDIYIDVLDARQRVLILASAPHPDVSALRQAFDGSKNFEADFALLGDFEGSIGEYDLVVLHSIPTDRADAAEILRALDDSGAGRWVITGVSQTQSQLSNVQSLLRISPRAGQINEVVPTLKGNFRLFSLDDAAAQTVKNYPPAVAPFAEFGELAAGDVLLQQRIGRVDTDFPLLAMGEVNGRKEAVFAGQGLWRWRLSEFQQNGNYEVFDGLVLATAQYLALKEDKRPFRVSSAERVYTTSEDIRLSGELYNASFQLVNEPDVSVIATDAAGKSYTFVMDKTGSAYGLRIGRFPAGSYSFTATTSYDGQAYESSGRFTVRALELEAVETTADWALLRRLTSQQGGRLVAPGTLDDLAEELNAASNAKPVLYQSVRTRPLIDWPWLLAIALALLSVEWFLRRRLGSY